MHNSKFIIENLITFRFRFLCDIKHKLNCSHIIFFHTRSKQFNFDFSEFSTVWNSNPKLFT